MLDLLNITKPKKRENGTYAGNIFLDEKNRYVLHAPSSIIVAEKDISEAEKYIYIKNKKINNEVCDLNKAVIDIVKDNCENWFRNSINPDLVEEYYTNTIVYDKKYGDLIRLKVVEFEHEMPMHKPVNLVLTLTNIRFYKQKFVIEWVLEEVKPATLDVRNLFDVDESDEEEAVAEPLCEDIESICEEYMRILSDRKQVLHEQLNEVQTKLDQLLGLEDLLSKVQSEETFFQICEQLDKFLE